jgi:ABC-type cobalamin transport system ATPase subunit
MESSFGQQPLTASATLAVDVAARAARHLVGGNPYGSSPHLAVVRVMVPAQISGLLLGDGG